MDSHDINNIMYGSYHIDSGKTSTDFRRNIVLVVKDHIGHIIWLVESQAKPEWGKINHLYASVMSDYHSNYINNVLCC